MYDNSVLVHVEEGEVDSFDFSLHLYLPDGFLGRLVLQRGHVDEHLVGLTIAWELEGRFEEGDDLIDRRIFLLQLLVMAATLKGVAGGDKPRHLFVELVGSKWTDKYLRFSFERIFYRL